MSILHQIHHGQHCVLVDPSPSLSPSSTASGSHMATKEMRKRVGHLPSQRKSRSSVGETLLSSACGAIVLPTCFLECRRGNYRLSSTFQPWGKWREDRGGKIDAGSLVASLSSQVALLYKTTKLWPVWPSVGFYCCYWHLDMFTADTHTINTRHMYMSMHRILPCVCAPVCVMRAHAFGPNSQGKKSFVLICSFSYLFIYL